MVIDKTTFWTVQNKTRLWYVPGPARQWCSGLVASSNADGDGDNGAGSLALTPQLLMLYFYYLDTAPGARDDGVRFHFSPLSHCFLLGFSLSLPAGAIVVQVGRKLPRSTAVFIAHILKKILYVLVSAPHSLALSAVVGSVMLPGAAQPPAPRPLPL